MSESDTILYVFVRTNLDSMNEGKGQAHSSHASNAFVYEQYYNIKCQAFAGKHAMVEEWMMSTSQGFGTQSNMKAEDWKDLDKLYLWAVEHNYACNFVLDPTYPFEVSNEVYSLLDPKYTKDAIVRKDSVICFRPEVTGFYIFGRRSDVELQKELRKYKRHP